MNAITLRFVWTTLLSASLLAGCRSDEPAAPAVSVHATSTAPASTQTPPPFDAQALWQRAKATFTPLPEIIESAANPSTPEKIALGRQLYYEKRLSRNHDLSCNSCHNLASFGVDDRAPGAKTSSGHKGQLGGRNSPTVYNAALQLAQFWDGRAADVEAQARGPIVNPVEMAMPSEEAAVAVIASIPGYDQLFRAAFPGEDKPLNMDNLAKAIAAFERRLVTPSRFDKYLGGDSSALSEQEQKGLLTFLDAGCIACHNGPALGGGMYQKLGLLKPYATADLGRFEHTKSEADKFFFKVPVLRNVAKTAPYFHDGSIATLEEAVKIMAEYQTAKGSLEKEELENLVAFLESLTGEIPSDYIVEPSPLASGKNTPKPDPS